MAINGNAQPATLRRARALLADRPQSESFGSIAFAAVFFAISALGLALTILTIPPHWGS